MTEEPPLSRAELVATLREEGLKRYPGRTGRRDGLPKPVSGPLGIALLAIADRLDKGRSL